MTTEAGGTATFTVVLTSTPTADVTITLSSSNPDEGTVSPALLTFTPDNALIPQTVTIIGVDDRSIDGDVAYTIALDPAISTDANYNGLDPDDVTATNRDDDVPAPPTSLLTGTPAQQFVARLYLDLFGRPADPPGLAVHSTLVDRGVPRAQVAQAIMNSPEYRTKRVQELYRTLLGRAADPQGLRAHVDFLARGGTVDQLRAALLGSPEYFDRAGGTNEGFLAALYRDLFGRSIDTSGAQVYGRLLGLGAPRALVVAAVLDSEEHAHALIGGFYRRFLDRGGDRGEYDAWVGARLRGLREEGGIVGFLTSAEYFARR